MNTLPHDRPPQPGDHMPEAADDAMPDSAPSSAHSFSKESMIIEPPTFKEMPDFGDVQSPHFWNLLWFNFGRPILIGGLWLATALLITHVAVHWSDMPQSVLMVAAVVAALLLLASLQRRFFPRKARKKTERTHGSEVSAFFGTDKDAHRQLRHSKRIDAYFDAARVGLCSEKQNTVTWGKLPFTAKSADNMRPLHPLHPGNLDEARQGGAQLPEGR